MAMSSLMFDYTRFYVLDTDFTIKLDYFSGKAQNTKVSTTMNVPKMFETHFCKKHKGAFIYYVTPKFMFLTPPPPPNHAPSRL